jgi:GNAT superfamily N-acetyltransferase
MNKGQISSIIKIYLSELYKCGVSDLEGGKTVFTVNNTVKPPYIKIMSFFESTVISTTPEVAVQVEALLKGKSKDEIYEFPFVYGHTIHFIPDVAAMQRMKLPEEYSYELIEGDDINRLYPLPGFDNSLVFDDDGTTKTRIVFCAKEGDEIIGLAGAGVKAESLWEIGIDVKPEHRKNGLGTRLVNNLTLELMNRGIAVFYSASITNIASQMTAIRGGYVPYWIDTFGNVLDGSSPYTATVENMRL